MIPSPSDKRTILLVDDNTFNRDGMRLYLENHGYAVLEAGDHAEAYATAVAMRPWAAVVDIVIPPRTGARANIDHAVGLELVRQLKEMDPVMGIVVFSAHEDRGGLVWDQVRDGVRGIAYLLKGVHPQRLLDALDQVAAGEVVLDGIAPTNRHHLGEEILDRLSAEERPWVIRAVILIPALSEQEHRIGLRIAVVLRGHLGNAQPARTAAHVKPRHIHRHRHPHVLRQAQQTLGNARLHAAQRHRQAGIHLVGGHIHGGKHLLAPAQCLDHRPQAARHHQRRIAQGVAHAARARQHIAVQHRAAGKWRALHGRHQGVGAQAVGAGVAVLGGLLSLTRGPREQPAEEAPAPAV